VASATISWLQEPGDDDHRAARSFLSLVFPPVELERKLAALRDAPQARWTADEILRAAGLPALKPKRSAQVADELDSIKRGLAISPVLLVAGVRPQLIIAAGYQRVCAVHRVDERAQVPGRLLWTS
jgi:hypothetical protein